LGLRKQPPAAVHGPEATANFAKVVGLLVVVGEEVGPTVGEEVGPGAVGELGGVGGWRQFSSPHDLNVYRIHDIAVAVRAYTPG